jgi:hypothetical protein
MIVDINDSELHRSFKIFHIPLTTIYAVAEGACRYLTLQLFDIDNLVIYSSHVAKFSI